MKLISYFFKTYINLGFPDKGNGIVIVNELDCLNKLKLLISDESKYLN